MNLKRIESGSYRYENGEQVYASVTRNSSRRGYQERIGLRRGAESVASLQRQRIFASSTSYQKIETPVDSVRLMAAPRGFTTKKSESAWNTLGRT